MLITARGGGRVSPGPGWRGASDGGRWFIRYGLASAQNKVMTIFGRQETFKGKRFVVVTQRAGPADKIFSAANKIPNARC